MLVELLATLQGSLLFHLALAYFAAYPIVTSILWVTTSLMFRLRWEPRNDEVVKYLKNAIGSFKEMADYGGTVGVNVTIENHWGLSADPMNIRIILDELKHPFCEASPDFFNWEHEFMLYHGLEALMPYTHTHVHAKYWNRWDPVDVGRCVRILDKAGYKGTIALEYEDGPWDSVEGAKQLVKLVMEA